MGAGVSQGCPEAVIFLLWVQCVAIPDGPAGVPPHSAQLPSRAIPGLQLPLYCSLLCVRHQAYQAVIYFFLLFVINCICVSKLDQATTFYRRLADF